MSKAGWWYRASQDEKLAQVKAGIELGMTAEQVARNCGCFCEGHRTGNGGGTVAQFAARHGLSFAKRNRTHNQRRHADLLSAKASISMTGTVPDWVFSAPDADQFLDRLEETS
jgi:hypothetical protein